MRLLLLTTAALVAASLPTAAQNVGIGTTQPNNGRVVIKHTGTSSALVVSDSLSGISFCENSAPVIAFNNYYNAGRKHMATGYASYFYFQEGVGSLHYANSSATGTQGSTVSLTTRMTINKDGEMGLGLSSPTEGLHLRDRNIRIDKSSTQRAMMLLHTSSGIGNGGEIRLFAHDDADSTLIIRGSDAPGQGGEILFIDPGGTGTTMELDGDYAGTGRSRIIVDELQIKGGSDFAEFFDVASAGSAEPEAGMLVCIDEGAPGKLVVSSKAGDRKVAGVISGAGGVRPGLMMGQGGSVANGAHPVAITGRVFVKAEASRRAIQPGDLLMTSDMPGHAMRAGRGSRGAVIGKAMSGLAKGEKGTVLVLLGIQ